MTVLTIEIPDRETKFVTEFVKKIGGKVKKQNNVENSPYDPKFVKKILQGVEDIKNGKGVIVDVENLWK
jgi:hypothetical protein